MTTLLCHERLVVNNAQRDFSRRTGPLPEASTCIEDIRLFIQINRTMRRTVASQASRDGVRVFLISISLTDGLLKKDPEVKIPASISLSIITTNPVLLDL